MAYPLLAVVVISGIIPVVGVPIVYLLSKALKIHQKPIAIAEPKKEASLAIIVYVILFLMAFGWFALGSMFQLEPLRFPFDVSQVWVLVLSEGVSLLIVIAVIKSTRQKLGTIGISKTDTGRMIALGAILSGIFLAVSGLLTPYTGGGFAGLSPSLAFALVFCTIVGFSEETVWRGYIQTRLVAYGGSIKGLVATVLLFAFAHFPTAYYLEASGDVFAALAWTSLRIGGPNLILGYTMLKSQNIVPSSIVHTFYDWAIYLWQLVY